MKSLIAAAILALAATACPVYAQVYGTNDNPYEVNPFASNMVVPQEPAPSPGAASPAAPTSAPQQSDSGRAQQTAAGSNPDTKKKTGPDR